jgi:hypothetical protein
MNFLSQERFIFISAKRDTVFKQTNNDLLMILRRSKGKALDYEANHLVLRSHWKMIVASSLNHHEKYGRINNTFTLSF